jgi:hypothetical protein
MTTNKSFKNGLMKIYQQTFQHFENQQKKSVSKK